LLLRLIAQRADAVLAASHDLVAAATGNGAKNVQFGPVVAPVLPAPTLPASQVRAELRAGLGLAADDPRRLVLAVGRLAPQKDYATLLKALILMAERFGPAEVPPVAIAGEGRQRSELQALIDAHRLPVALLGQRSDIASLLRAADVFVMCSTWEARPLALQEALRAGVPRVIATDVGGVAEVTAGYLPLIAPGDPEALSRALADACCPATPAADSPDWDALWPGPAEELAAVLAAYSA
jgi:glycosyltransferase involved in cell wall biosynthesis